MKSLILTCALFLTAFSGQADAGDSQKPVYPCIAMFTIGTGVASYFGKPAFCLVSGLRSRLTPHWNVDVLISVASRKLNGYYGYLVSKPVALTTSGGLAVAYRQPLTATMDLAVAVQEGIAGSTLKDYSVVTGHGTRGTALHQSVAFSTLYFTQPSLSAIFKIGPTAEGTFNCRYNIARKGPGWASAADLSGFAGDMNISFQFSSGSGQHHSRR